MNPELKPKACAARINESILAMILTLTFDQFNQSTALEMASGMASQIWQRLIFPQQWI
jgi:hypothetical protein